MIAHAIYIAKYLVIKKKGPRIKQTSSGVRKAIDDKEKKRKTKIANVSHQLFQDEKEQKQKAPPKKNPKQGYK